jgi:hypothetical protein
MNKQTTRNVLVVLGLWAFSKVIALSLKTLIVVIHNQMTFRGDVGRVTMWLWEGFPDDLVAGLAAITLLW